MTTLLAQIRPVARTVTWSALLAGGLACVAVVVVAPLASPSSPFAHWPGFGAVALCAGAAFLLDDAAATIVDATPTRLRQRLLLRIAIALPLLCGVWAGSLWYATAADGAIFGPETRATLSLQLGAVLALTLAASAVALRAMPGEHGGWTGAFVPFAVLSVAVALPERWTLLAAPGDGAWHPAQQRWAVLLALGLLTFAWASREPTGRMRGPGSVSVGAGLRRSACQPPRGESR